jgi:hypothetical protein
VREPDHVGPLADVEERGRVRAETGSPAASMAPRMSLEF